MRDLRKSSHRRFQVVLIKPSHYDDDGYVIQWLRSLIPSNSLAAVYSLIADAIDRSVLGPDIEAELSAVDECHTRVSVAKIIRQFERNGGFGMVGLVGVQSNQFPRALDIARPLRAAGIPVVIGGFHVSGCLAMIPQMPADLQEALDLGISLFAGELENRVDDLLRDVVAGRLSPIYNYLNDLPGIEAAPPPILPRAYIRGTVGHYTSFDAGRGCPFQCSFCTIINVQGRTSRRRSADDIEKLIRLNWAQGVRRFFITDDNFARNKDWELIFDRMIRLRVRDKIKISCIIQVDTLCHKIPNFIDKAAKAGVRRVFIGLENINPDNLLAAKKRQNKIVEYREMLLEWKKHGVMTYAGYILGFPADTPESIRRDIEIIKAELPLDIIEFFFLTPLPGSEDHKALWLKGVAMDPDMNKYDLEHVCTAHGQMSGREWEAIYREAWSIFYTPEHIATILRRAKATRFSAGRMLANLYNFATSVPIEDVHPLQGGVFRIKRRRDRRPGLPIEPMFLFYPRYAFETARKHIAIGRWWLRSFKTRRRLEAEPAGIYTDRALAPITSDETDTLELLTQSPAARRAVAHSRKVRELTHPGGR